MTCTSVEKYSAAFVDRELSARLRHNVTLHLAECPPCRDVIQMQKRIKRLVQTGAKTLPAPAALRWRIQLMLYHHHQFQKEE